MSQRYTTNTRKATIVSSNPAQHVDRFSQKYSEFIKKRLSDLFDKEMDGHDITLTDINVSYNVDTRNFDITYTYKYDKTNISQMIQHIQQFHSQIPIILKFNSTKCEIDTENAKALLQKTWFRKAIEKGLYDRMKYNLPSTLQDVRLDRISITKEGKHIILNSEISFCTGKIPNIYVDAIEEISKNFDAIVDADYSVDIGIDANYFDDATICDRFVNFLLDRLRQRLGIGHDIHLELDSIKIVEHDDGEKDIIIRIISDSPTVITRLKASILSPQQIQRHLQQFDKQRQTLKQTKTQWGQAYDQFIRRGGHGSGTYGIPPKQTQNKAQKQATKYNPILTAQLKRLLGLPS